MSVNETLTFRVNVQIAGAKPSDIDALNKALTGLGTLKFGTGTSAELNKISSAVKPAKTAVDQLTTSSKALGGALSGITGPANSGSGALRQLGVGAGSAKTGMDSAKASAAGLVSGLNPLTSMFRQVGAAATQSIGGLTNTFQTARSGMAVYTAEGKKVETTNAAITASATGTTSALEKLRTVYTSSGTATTRSMASTQALSNELTRQNAVLNQTTANMERLAMVALAFQKGRSSIKDFATEFHTAGAEAAGTLLELDAFAQTVGTDLPDNMKLTTDSAKQMIMAFGDSVGALKELEQIGRASCRERV